MPSSSSGLLRSSGAASAALAPSSTHRSSAALLVLLAALMVLGLAAAAPSANAADRNFQVRFSANDTGDIDIFGNTLMTCPDSTACTAARNAGVTTTANSSSQNNNYNMRFVDVDGNDFPTFNSSRANVALPAGSTVLFAGLYWGARTSAGAGGVAARNAADRDVIKFRVPGASGLRPSMRTRSTTATTASTRASRT